MEKKKKYKLGWKVVSFRRAFRQLIYESSNKGELRYAHGKITVPEKGNGPLCVFTDKHYALDFRSVELHRVFPCAYIPSRSRKVWINSLWGRKCTSLHYLPEGKALAKEVILLREGRKRKNEKAKGR